MPRPYSEDLRSRVIKAVAARNSCRKAAATFQVSVSTIIKWVQRWQMTGSATAKPVATTVAAPKPRSRDECAGLIHRMWLGWQLGSIDDALALELFQDVRQSLVKLDHRVYRHS
ncbi:MAG TPA: helix-turn-helix domain-containing protein [Lysobacter sp.]|jgi:transposase|nr:helix-turn-helix domain-containing protein [Lysobacter sp.]